VVALWGIESNYGTRLGDFEVVAALATLAYNNFRAQFFQPAAVSIKIALQRENSNLHCGSVAFHRSPAPFQLCFQF